MDSLIMTLSGTRGIVGKNLPPTVATETGMAFGTLVKQGPVIVGGDTRTSHDMLKFSVISGLLASGVDVIDIGKVPTPTVQQMIRHYSASGGIVVTASHNPVIWNGLKIMNKTGSFLDTQEFSNFETIYHQKDFHLADWKRIGTLTTDTKALEKHIDLILKNIDTSSIRASKLNVIIDGNNGAGCLPDKLLLDRLNVSYTIINEEANGIFDHNPEPTEKNLTSLITEMKKGDYDIGFAQDADADRLVILDETGHFIGEDYSLAFCIDYVLSQDKTPNNKVVVNLSTSNIIEWVAHKHNAIVTQTKIGESNVTQGIKDEKAIVGGEGNGGIIYPKIGWGRDSLVGIVLALNHLAETKKTLSQIISDYPKYVMIREKIAISSKEAVKAFITQVENKFNDNKKNQLDGLKILLPNAWIHVRPSNTEPIVRIFIEAESKEKAEELLAKVQG